MPGSIYDFCGLRWVRQKKQEVDLCVNEYATPLFGRLRTIDPGKCHASLPPILRWWLNEYILPAVESRIRGAQQAENYERWSTGLALFTFGPTLDARAVDPQSAPDLMTRAICSSMPKLQRCLMAQRQSEAKAILGQCLGNYFSDAKFKLLATEGKGLKITTWYRIEPVMREIKDEWMGRPYSVEELAQEILARCGKKLDITCVGTIIDYIFVFRGGIDPIPPIPLEDVLDGPSEPITDGLLLELKFCLDAKDGPNALTEQERDAVRREYFEGIPSGQSEDSFKEKYGLSRKAHRRHANAGRLKLGRCLLDQCGETE